MQNIIVTSLSIEFSDSSSRHVSIYGNGWNQVPVIVTVSLVDAGGPVEGFDYKILSDAITFFHKKDDRPVNKEFPSDSSKKLSSSSSSINFNHAKYGNSDLSLRSSEKQGNHGLYRISQYLSSAEENANYQIYAKFKLEQGAEVKTESGKHLNISTLPAIQWCLPSLWKTEEFPGGIACNLDNLNIRQPLNTVTHKPAKGPDISGNIMLTSRMFKLKYGGNSPLPSFKITSGLLAKKTEFYDIRQNTLPSSMSHYVNNNDTDVTRNSLALWYVLAGQNAPVLEGKVDLMIASNSDSNTDNFKEVYLEKLFIPAPGKPVVFNNTGIVLFCTSITHTNVMFFAVSAPESNAERDIVICLIDDFGNHGSITANIKGTSVPQLLFSQTLPLPII